MLEEDRLVTISKRVCALFINQSASEFTPFSLTNQQASLQLFQVVPLPLVWDSARDTGTVHVTESSKMDRKIARKLAMIDPNARSAQGGFPGDCLG